MKNASGKIQLWIQENMQGSVISLHSTVPASEAAKILEDSKTSAIIVLENHIPVGIITNRDLMVKIVAHSYPLDTPIRRIMSSPLISIPPNTEITRAINLMTLKKIRKLPIIDDNEILGMIIASEITNKMSEA